MITYLHFCGADGPDGFLDVHHRSPIEYRKAAFGSAAHLLVFLEARFYGDEASEASARFATSPKVVQAVAASIRRNATLDQAWQQQRAREIGYAMRLKFKQHPELAKRLLGTGDALLCYANPTDRILGIGVADDHPNACQPHRWVGQNLLGLALTTVRARLSLAGNQESMHENNELARDSDRGSSLGVLPAALCEPQPRLAQVTVLSKRTEGVVRGLNCESPHDPIPGLRNPQLFVAVGGLILLRIEADVRANFSTLGKTRLFLPA